MILDEPTNHLDIDSRAALIEAINAYPGAVILVSHDRHLVEACADRLWLVADGQVAPFDGDLDDYRRRVLAERGASARGMAGAMAARRAPAARTPGAPPPKGVVELAPLRRRITEAEAAVASLNEEIRRIDAALAEPGLFARDPARAAALAKARAEHVDTLAKAEEDWLEASTALEADAGA